MFPCYCTNSQSCFRQNVNTIFIIFNCSSIDFLIDNIYVRFGNSVFRQVVDIPMGTNSAPLLADLFLHTFEYNFMLTTMKQDMTKAVSFGYTLHYIDDLFSVNNDSFEEYISSTYPSELELKDTTMASNEVCYLDTAHLTISACTTREMTSTFGSTIFPIWIVTSQPILPTVFIYLN